MINSTTVESLSKFEVPQMARWDQCFTEGETLGELRMP